MPKNDSKRNKRENSSEEGSSESSRGDKTEEKANSRKSSPKKLCRTCVSRLRLCYVKLIGRTLIILFCLWNVVYFSICVCLTLTYPSSTVMARWNEITLCVFSGLALLLSSFGLVAAVLRNSVLVRFYFMGMPLQLGFQVPPAWNAGWVRCGCHNFLQCEALRDFASPGTYTNRYPMPPKARDYFFGAEGTELNFDWKSPPDDTAGKSLMQTDSLCDSKVESETFTLSEVDDKYLYRYLLNELAKEENQSPDQPQQTQLQQPALPPPQQTQQQQPYPPVPNQTQQQLFPVPQQTPQQQPPQVGTENSMAGGEAALMKDAATTNSSIGTGDKKKFADGAAGRYHNQIREMARQKLKRLRFVEYRKQAKMTWEDWLKYVKLVKKQNCRCDHSGKEGAGGGCHVYSQINDQFAREDNLRYWCPVLAKSKKLCEKFNGAGSVMKSKKAGAYWTYGACEEKDDGQRISPKNVGTCSCVHHMGYRVRGADRQGLAKAFLKKAGIRGQKDDGVMIGYKCDKWFKKDEKPWCVVGFDSSCADRKEISISVEDGLRVYTSSLPCEKGASTTVIHDASEACQRVMLVRVIGEIITIILWPIFFGGVYFWYNNRCSDYDGGEKETGWKKEADNSSGSDQGDRVRERSRKGEGSYVIGSDDDRSDEEEYDYDSDTGRKKNKKHKR